MSQMLSLSNFVLSSFFHFPFFSRLLSLCQKSSSLAIYSFKVYPLRLQYKIPWDAVAYHSRGYRIER